MADDTIDIIEPFDFHPCNSPRGMLYYDLPDLTDDQQIQLNKFKRNSVRENEKYLAAHPEIRALIALTSRYVFLHRPRTNLPEFIGQFFLRSKLDIEREVEEYIKSRDPHVYEGDSAVGLNAQYRKEPVSVVTFPEEEEDYKDIPKELLDEIIERALTRLETRDWRSFDADEKAAIIKGVISDIIQKALDDRERILEYLFKSQEDLVGYESTIATLDDLTTVTTEILSATSGSDTDVKNVTEIELNEKTLDQTLSEATETAVNSQLFLDLSEEQSEENFGQSQVVVELPQDIVEQPQEIVEQPQEIVEQPQETVEEPPAVAAEDNEAHPAEEPT